MQFRPLPVPDSLRAAVRAFWTLEAAGVPSPPVIRTVADGFPGLVWQQPGGVPLLDAAHEPWASGFLFGQATQAGGFRAPGPFRMLGVTFQPGGLAAVFGLAADELTDSCVRLDELPGGSALTEQLLHAPAVADQLALLTAQFRTGLARHQARVPAAIDYCIARLEATGGAVPLPALQREAAMSERNLQRRFRQVVGLSPKLFARICQFRASLAQVGTAQYDKLSDVAYAHAYADQSHHIRAFREFTGLPPQQFRARTHEVVATYGVPD